MAKHIIRSQNDDLIFRGKKLVLNYTGGSPCPTASERDKRARLPNTTESMHAAKETDDDGRDGKSTQRRKSTVISLLCEHDLTQPKVSVSFVAVSPDECTYFFEARTSAACATVNVETRAVGPGAVFGVMCVVQFHNRLGRCSDNLQICHCIFGLPHWWYCLPTGCNASTRLETTSQLRHLGGLLRLHQGHAHHSHILVHEVGARTAWLQSCK